MTRKLALSARQVAAICRGAAEAGFVAEVKIGDVFVRLMPAGMAQAQGVGFDPDKPETFQTLDQYIVWRDAQEEKERTKGIVTARLAALEAGRYDDPILVRPHPAPRRKSKGVVIGKAKRQ